MGQQVQIDVSDDELRAGRRRLMREGLFGYVYNSATLAPVAEHSILETLRAAHRRREQDAFDSRFAVLKGGPALPIGMTQGKDGVLHVDLEAYGQSSEKLGLSDGPIAYMGGHDDGDIVGVGDRSDKL